MAGKEEREEGGRGDKSKLEMRRGKEENTDSEEWKRSDEFTEKMNECKRG